MKLPVVSTDKSWYRLLWINQTICNTKAISHEMIASYFLNDPVVLHVYWGDGISEHFVPYNRR